MPIFFAIEGFPPDVTSVMRDAAELASERLIAGQLVTLKSVDVEPWPDGRLMKAQALFGRNDHSHKILFNHRAPFSPGWKDPRAQMQQPVSIGQFDSGPPYGHSSGKFSAAAAIYHEAGHIADFVLRGMPEARSELLMRIARHLEVSNPYPESSYEAANTISSNLSRYAGVNSTEIIPEAVAEVLLSDRPRPLAKMIVDFLENEVRVRDIPHVTSRDVAPKISERGPVGYVDQPHQRISGVTQGTVAYVQTTNGTYLKIGDGSIVGVNASHGQIENYEYGQFSIGLGLPIWACRPGQSLREEVPRPRRPLVATGEVIGYQFDLDPAKITAPLEPASVDLRVKFEEAYHELDSIGSRNIEPGISRFTLNLSDQMP